MDNRDEDKKEEEKREDKEEKQDDEEEEPDEEEFLRILAQMDEDIAAALEMEENGAQESLFSLGGFNRAVRRAHEFSTDLSRQIRDAVGSRPMPAIGTDENGNATFEIQLTPVPGTYGDTNRIELPSALFRIIDNAGLIGPGKPPLVFELSIRDGDGNVIERTHAGLEGFYAEPNMVVLPPKTALSLCKNRGYEWLDANNRIHIRLAQVVAPEESFMQIQPKGRGFVKEDDTIEDIDIQYVLERTLRNHMVVTKGDFIPLFHDGKTFVMQVKDTDPAETMLMLNTELHVDLLPSEDTEEEIKQEEKRKAKEKRGREKRLLKKQKVVNESPEPMEKDKAVAIRVRLPNGGTVTRAFALDVLLGVVLDWIELEMAGSLPNLPNKSDQYSFQLVDNTPGGRHVYSGKDAWKTLEQAGFKPGSRVALITELKPAEEAEKTKKKTNKKKQNKNKAKEEKSNEEDGEETPEAGINRWEVALLDVQNKVAQLEREGIDEGGPMVDPEEAEYVTTTLMNDFGYEIGEASRISTLYTRQILQLEQMSIDWDLIVAQGIPLLDKHKGNLDRAMNDLFIAMETFGDAHERNQVENDEDENENND